MQGGYMFIKSHRSLLLFLFAFILMSWSYFSTDRRAQASTDGSYLGINASTGVTGPIFIQPRDPSGKLLLSSWLEPDGSNGDRYVWDNFTLQKTETITEIGWFGGYDPMRFGDGGPVIDFSVSIYPSIAANTEPAVAYPPLLEYQTGGNAGETSIGKVGGIPMYAYAFNLPVPFIASAGVKYWVQIEAYQHGSIPDWGFSVGTGGNGSHYVKESGAGGDIIYRSAPYDVAFTLLGPIADTPRIYLSIILR